LDLETTALMESVSFHFRFDVSPPIADAAASGCDADDNRNQDHCEQHSVFDSGCAAFAEEELSNRSERFHHFGPSEKVQETVGKPYFEKDDGIENSRTHSMSSSGNCISLHVKVNKIGQFITMSQSTLPALSCNVDQPFGQSE
jgi:hypothetical protein